MRTACIAKVKRLLCAHKMCKREAPTHGGPKHSSMVFCAVHSLVCDRLQIS